FPGYTRDRKSSRCLFAKFSNCKEHTSLPGRYCPPAGRTASLNTWYPADIGCSRLLLRNKMPGIILMQFVGIPEWDICHDLSDLVLYDSFRKDREFCALCLIESLRQSRMPGGQKCCALTEHSMFQGKFNVP